MVPHNSDDIDKLLELANHRPKPAKLPKVNPEIDSFISQLKITSGKKRIHNSIIYHRYFTWKKSDTFIAKRSFFDYFSTKFKKERTKDGLVYLLNPVVFDLTPQSHFRARAFLRKLKDERKKG